MAIRAKASSALQFLLDNSLLLVIGATAGLVWANLDSVSYAMATRHLGFVVNDVGMVFFFALMTKEVYEAMLPGGPLASWREAAVPVFAAVGGMVVPAGLFAGSAAALGQPDLIRGWAIPCATDIAFAYLAARLIFRRGHPAIPFLLLLAIADDAMGLAILAIGYPTRALAPGLLGVGLAVAIGFAWMLRRMGVGNFWWYVLGPGTISWIALHEGGLHPALALVPIVPAMPHARSTLKKLGSDAEVSLATMQGFEEWWKVPVQVVLLLFGIVNAGVPLASVGTVTGLVLVSLVVGKPVGIVVTTALAEWCGFRRPEGLDYRSVLTLGVAAGIGFTVALFFATAAFPAGDLLNEAKMGALLSVVAFPMALMVGKAVRRANL